MNGFESIWELVQAAASAATSDDAARTAAWFVALVFAWSGAAKIRRPRLAALALVDFRVLSRVAPNAGRALGLAEVGLSLLLISGAVLGRPVAAIGAGIAAGAFLAFSAAIAASLRRRARFDCFCFGAADAAISRWTLARAVALSGVAAATAVLSQGVPAASAAEAVLPGTIAAAVRGSGVLLGQLGPLVRWNGDPFGLDDRLFEQREPA